MLPCDNVAATYTTVLACDRCTLLIPYRLLVNCSSHVTIDATVVSVRATEGNINFLPACARDDLAIIVNFSADFTRTFFFGNLWLY